MRYSWRMSLFSVLLVGLFCIRQSFAKGGGGGGGSRGGGSRRRSGTNSRSCTESLPCSYNDIRYYKQGSSYYYSGTDLLLTQEDVDGIKGETGWSYAQILSTLVMFGAYTFCQYRFGENSDVRRLQANPDAAFIERNAYVNDRRYAKPLPSAISLSLQHLLRHLSLQKEWCGNYTEDGKTKVTHYQLRFMEGDSTFSGCGNDSDGDFIVEGGTYCLETGRCAWGERAKRSKLYAECRATATVSPTGTYQSSTGTYRVELEGTYRASTGKSGRLTLFSPPTVIETDTKVGSLHRKPPARVPYESEEEPAKKTRRLEAVDATDSRSP